MKQVETNAPHQFDTAFKPITGTNAEAKSASDAAKAALDNIAVDKDALLLAERNDVLDHAIERLRDGDGWTTGHLAEDQFGNVIDSASLDEGLTVEFAELFRTSGHKFCLVGAIGAELGPHSYEAVNAAIEAVSEILPPRYVSNGILWASAYGFRRGGVWARNDDGTAQEIIEAMRKAKSQPLRKE